jgi:hypothetical protein
VRDVVRAHRHSHMHATARGGLCVDLVGGLLEHFEPSTRDVHFGPVDGKASRDGCG